MIEKIGFVVLGQAAADDIVPALRRQLPPHVHVLARGALDGLTPAEIDALAPKEDDYLLVCRVEPGREAQVVFDQMLPRVQDAVHRLESEGADLIVVLCGANWSELKSTKLLINPGAILPQLAIALSRGKKLGVIMPTVLQVEPILHKYRKLGATDLVATHVTIYDDTLFAGEIETAANFLIREGVDLVWMPCLGMGNELRAAIQQRVKRPTILAQSMLAKVVHELIAWAPNVEANPVPAVEQGRGT